MNENTLNVVFTYVMGKKTRNTQNKKNVGRNSQTCIEQQGCPWQLDLLPPPASHTISLGDVEDAQNRSTSIHVE